VLLLPRFYFQVIENDVAGPLDKEGVDYTSLAAAEDDTEAVIARMMESTGLTAGSKIEVVISDESRRPLSRLKIVFSRTRMS
jgi:hypothetical protein